MQNPSGYPVPACRPVSIPGAQRGAQRGRGRLHPAGTVHRSGVSAGANTVTSTAVPRGGPAENTTPAVRPGPRPPGHPRDRCAGPPCDPAGTWQDRVTSGPAPVRPGEIRPTIGDPCPHARQGPAVPGRRSARRGTGAGPGARFLVLDRADTAIGELSLRRRHDPVAGVEVFEAKLGDEFLMSSLFTVAEIALAVRGLAAVDGDALDVVVGGLGLGYTAVAVLDDPRVRSVTVVEALPEVIAWHRAGLLPASDRLVGDPRVVLRCADFFAQVADGDGLDPECPGRRYDAVLVDIDHAPDHVLAPAHAGFYEAAGLRRLLPSLREDGVLGLWSDRPPLDAFGVVLGEVFSRDWAEVVPFPNPLTGSQSANTVYLARR